MARIFISHSSLDNETASWLKTWLEEKGFEQTFLDIDKDSGIQPGAEWEKTLYREIERAQAVVIVVTDHWLASKWCFAEFTQARALGKVIFPLIVAPTGEKIIGEDLQNIDLMSDRDGGLDRLGKALTQVAMQSPEGFDLPEGTVPFPGLSSFEERHAAVFYGRDPEIRKALERLRRCRTTSGEKLIVLLGASGSGKSSLLRAGLVPRLKRDRDNWITCPPFRPEADPLHRLIDTLLLAVHGRDASRTDEQRAREDSWREALAGPAPEKALKEIARELRRKAGAMDALILLPIDQAEEVFTNADAEEAASFFTLLNKLLGEALPFVGVAALRSDHLPDLQKEEALSAAYDLFPLDPMPLERIGTLVRGPAKLVDLKADDEMVSALVHDAESEDALPLIAFLLQKMFEKFGADKIWTLEHYRSLGNPAEGLSPLQNAVRVAAEEALPKLNEESDATLREAFIPDLVRINSGGSFVRRPARLADLDGKAQPLIRKLVEARLLVTRGSTEEAGLSDAEQPPTGASNVTTVEVAHESLFRVWPRLSGWIGEEREFLIGKARLEQYQADWEALSDRNRRKGLLTGVMLERARTWLIEHPGRFSTSEKEFIRLSNEAETEDRQRRERMRRNLFGALTAAVVILMAGVAASTYFYFQQKEQAKIAANEAERAEQEAKRANEALTAATQTANGLVFNLAQKFKNSGLPNATVREILQEARNLQDKLSAGFEDNAVLLRSRSVALIELADTYDDFGDPEAALRLLQESLNIARKLAKDKPQNTWFRRDISGVLERIADITLRQDPNEALKLYSQTLEIVRTLAEAEPLNMEFQRGLSISLDRIADITLTQDPTEALILYTQSLDIRRKLAEDEPQNAWIQLDLSISLEKIADITLRQDPAEALNLFTQSLDIRRKLAEDEPQNTQFQRNLSVSLEKIADITVRQDPNEALKLYTQSLDIRRKLAKDEPQNTQFQSDLSVSLNNIADITRRQDPTEALKLYNQSLEIRRKLAKDEPQNIEFQRRLSVSLEKIAEIALGQDPNEALKLFRQSHAILAKLAQEEPKNTRFQHLLSKNINNIALITSTWNPGEALVLYRKSHEILTQLTQEEPENTLFRHNLSLSLRNIAQIVLIQDPSEALMLNKKSVEIQKMLVEKEPKNTQFRYDLSVGLNQIAFITNQKDPSEALNIYRQSFDILTKLKQEEPENTQFQHYLSVTINDIAAISVRQHPKVALELYMLSLEILTQLTQKEPENTAFQIGLSVNLRNVAKATLRQDPREALKLHRQSIEILTKLTQKEPKNTVLQKNLAVSLLSVADILFSENPAEALSLYKKTQNIVRQLPDETENTKIATSLVVSLMKYSTLAESPNRIAALEDALKLVSKLENSGSLNAVQAYWPDLIRQILAKSK
ncbi:TIR domain-containing protein [Roseibium alexandrii]